MSAVIFHEDQGRANPYRHDHNPLNVDFHGGICPACEWFTAESDDSVGDAVSRCGECGGELEPFMPEDRPHIFWRCVECATAHGVRADEWPPGDES